MQHHTQKKQKKNLEEPPPPPPSMSVEQFSEVLFQPGMKYRGHIFIPGQPDTWDGDTGSNSRSSHQGNNDLSQNRATSEIEAQELGKTYELVVLEQGEDALGYEFILATHCAYDDHQCFNVQLNIREADIMDKEKGVSCQSGHQFTMRRLEVEYADGETCCFGYWNPEKIRFEGHVWQRLQRNDGVFHTSDSVTHVFTLYPCTSCFPAGRREGGIDETTGSAKLDGLVDETNKQRHSPLSPFEQDITSRDTRAIIAHRHRTYNALRKILQNYLVLFELIGTTSTESHMHQLRLVFGRRTDNKDIGTLLDEKQRLLWKLRDVHWAKILEESFKVGCERLCSKF